MAKLKQKRNILTMIAVFVVVAGALAFWLYNTRNTAPQAVAGWYDLNWSFRQSIEIANKATSAETDFQVRVLDGVDLSTDISDGKIQSDLADLRFTDKAGNILDYWIEDETDTSNVTAWIKIPPFSIGTSTIYMYYGNPC